MDLTCGGASSPVDCSLSIGGALGTGWSNTGAWVDTCLLFV